MQGKIKIPELHDIIPGAFRKHEGIRIKLKETGYESILTGGMAARITRQQKNRLQSEEGDFFETGSESLIKSGLKIPGNYNHKTGGIPVFQQGFMEVHDGSDKDE